MKKNQFNTVFAGLIIFLSIIACKKEIPGSFSNNNSAPVNGQPSNKILKVNAGPDVRLEIPFNYTAISGTTNSTNVKDYRWEKIGGPPSYFLWEENKASASVTWLEEGEYEFEFTVTENNGLSGKDSVKVTVFNNLKKYVINNLKRDDSLFITAQIPLEVKNNIKWVFVKDAGYFVKADAGAMPGVDYNFWGYYYLLSNNGISVYVGNDYSNPAYSITIYY